MDLRGRRQRSMLKLPRFYCFSVCFLFSVCALLSTSGARNLCFGTRSSSSRKLDCDEIEGASMAKPELFSDQRRRFLSGPGSSPPRCTSKCGKCTPCKPVHVPVPPGTPVTTEYYPEAWRCKCGNKLYMP